nr:hypothetical protein GCM10020093_002850 [Planobispora longispora]
MFVLGVLLILVFAVKLQVLPATGWTSISVDLGWNLTSVLLPAITLGCAQTAVYARLLRTDLIATLQEDYITLARARGLSPAASCGGTRCALRHLADHRHRPQPRSADRRSGDHRDALRAARRGRLIVESIFARDYLTVQGGVVLISVGYVLVNFAVDLVYVAVDPRIRRA